MSRQEVNILSMDAFQKVMRHQGIKPRTISVCSREPTGHRSPLATGAHWPQEPTGHRNPLATGAHWPQEPTGHRNPLATGTHWPQEPTGHRNPLATGTHWPQEPTGHRNPLATGTHWPQEPTGHRNPLATGAHWPQEPTGHRNPLATGTHWPQEPTGHRSPLATGTHWPQEPTGLRKTLSPYFIQTHALQHPLYPSDAVAAFCRETTGAHYIGGLKCSVPLLSFTPDQHAVEQGLDPEQAADSGVPLSLLSLGLNEQEESRWHLQSSVGL
ncbi:unnamed protein product [Arctogadus glacialis]